MNKKFTKREKSILIGLYLSKFDRAGLKYLGFDNFTQAFNLFALANESQLCCKKFYRKTFSRDLSRS